MSSEDKLLKTPDFEIDYRNYTLDKADALEQYHDSCEIDLFIKADLKVFLLDRQYEIGGCSLLFIGENEIHKILYSENMYYERYVLNVKKSYVGSILRALKTDSLLEESKSLSIRRIRLNRKQFEKIKGMFGELYAQKRNAQIRPDAEYPYAKTQLKLAELLLAVNTLLRSSQQPYVPGKSENKVQNILKFIDENFGESITLSLLEKRFYLNKYHIAHIFKEQTGFSVTEYIQLRRVIASQEMLKETDMRIVDICVECGFNNLQHFYRVFRKITRCTPLDYRKKAGSKKERDLVGIR